MDWLLSFIPGGGITAAIGGIVAALGLLFGLFKTVQKTGVDKQRAKEADAYAKHIQDIERAANARSTVKDGDLSDDGFRRD